MAVQLVQLPEVQRISPLIIRILGGNPGKFTLQGTNTYLVGNGSQRILIDTGEGRPSWIQAVRRVVNEQKVTVSKVLLTHWHGDHVGGIGDFHALYPGVKVYKNQPSEDQLDISDGERFAVEGATLRAVYSPGHTQDHMALILEEEDAMFTGDNVLGQGTAVFEDLGQYLKSLEKMRNLFSGKAYPGHGPVIEDGRAKIVEYIRHRQQREDQVLQTLRNARAEGTKSGISDSWTSMEIVKVIYKDIPENLHVPANGGILQVLGKLQKEDKVTHDSDSDRWKLVDKSTL